MTKKCKAPTNILYGAGVSPPAQLNVPEGECRQLVAFDLPENAEICLLRCESVCGKDYETPAKDANGEIAKLSGDCPSVVMSAMGRYRLSFSAPEGANFDCTLVAEYAVKPGAGGSTTVDVSGLAAIAQAAADAQVCADQAKMIAQANAATIAALSPDTDTRLGQHTTTDPDPDDGLKTCTFPVIDALTGEPTGETVSYDFPDSTELPDLDTDTFATLNAAGDTITFPNGDTFSVTPHPEVCLECSGNSVALVVDGVVKNRVALDQIQVKSGGVSNTIDGSVAAGDLYMDQVCRTINLADCPGYITVDLFSSYDVSTPAAGETLTTVPQISWDGGATWIPMATGGIDEVNLDGLGEESHVDTIQSPVLSGAVTVCVRNVVFAERMTDAALVGSSQTMTFEYMTCREC